MRKANVALRWRLLHRLCAQPKFKQLIEAQVSGRDVIDLLLQSAQLEFKVRDSLLFTSRMLRRRLAVVQRHFVSRCAVCLAGGLFPVTAAGSSVLAR
jgi:hypothetical protein